MKIAPNKIFVLFVTLLFSDFAFSAPNPPEPALPPPPGLPIDNGVYSLLLFSILFAFYKLSKIKKTSKI